MSDAGLLLAFAYPDRIGRRRAGAEARYTLANGRGAHFAEAQSLAREEFIVAVDLDDRERDARILLAAPLAEADIEEHFARSARSAPIGRMGFPRAGGDRAARRATRCARARGEAAARSVRRSDCAPRCSRAFANWASPHCPGTGTRATCRRAWSSFAGFDDSTVASRERCRACWTRSRPGSRRGSTASRAAIISRALTLADALRALLPWNEQRKLDELAPTHLEVPTGSRIRIDYLDESAPAVSVRLQEVFGLEQTPRIGGGRVPITFKLLSPAQRPVQVTRDLASFWRGAYADVRKDMRGRYPKHYWPENPLEAEPTRGVRRR